MFCIFGVMSGMGIVKNLCILVMGADGQVLFTSLAASLQNRLNFKLMSTSVGNRSAVTYTGGDEVV